MENAPMSKKHLLKFSLFLCALPALAAHDHAKKSKTSSPPEETVSVSTGVRQDVDLDAEPELLVYLGADHRVMPCFQSKSKTESVQEPGNFKITTQVEKQGDVRFLKVTYDYKQVRAIESAVGAKRRKESECNTDEEVINKIGRGVSYVIEKTYTLSMSDKKVEKLRKKLEENGDVTVSGDEKEQAAKAEEIQKLVETKDSLLLAEKSNLGFASRVMKANGLPKMKPDANFQDVIALKTPAGTQYGPLWVEKVKLSSLPVAK
jgi:hypothetical protein